MWGRLLVVCGNGEAIATAGNRDDVVRLAASLPQYPPNCGNLHLDVVLLDGEPRPNLLHERIFGDDLAAGRGQSTQEVQGPTTQRNR